MKNKNIKVIFISLFLLLFSIVFTSCGKNTISVPTNIKLENNILSWSKNENDQKYYIQLNETTFETKSNIINLDNYAKKNGEYLIRIASYNGKKTSEYSNYITYIKKSSEVIKLDPLIEEKNNELFIIWGDMNQNYDSYRVDINKKTYYTDNLFFSLNSLNLFNAEIASKYNNNLYPGTYNIKVTPIKNNIEIKESMSSKISFEITNDNIFFNKNVPFFSEILDFVVKPFIEVMSSMSGDEISFDELYQKVINGYYDIHLEDNEVKFIENSITLFLSNYKNVDKFDLINEMDKFATDKNLSLSFETGSAFFDVLIMYIITNLSKSMNNYLLDYMIPLDELKTLIDFGEELMEFVMLMLQNSSDDDFDLNNIYYKGTYYSLIELIDEFLGSFKMTNFSINNLVDLVFTGIDDVFKLLKKFEPNLSENEYKKIGINKNSTTNIIDFILSEFLINEVFDLDNMGSFIREELDMDLIILNANVSIQLLIDRLGQIFGDTTNKREQLKDKIKGVFDYIFNSVVYFGKLEEAQSLANFYLENSKYDDSLINLNIGDIISLKDELINSFDLTKPTEEEFADFLLFMFDILEIMPGILFNKEYSRKIEFTKSLLQSMSVNTYSFFDIFEDFLLRVDDKFLIDTLVSVNDFMSNNFAALLGINIVELLNSLQNLEPLLVELQIAANDIMSNLIIFIFQQGDSDIMLFFYKKVMDYFEQNTDAKIMYNNSPEEFLGELISNPTNFMDFILSVLSSLGPGELLELLSSFDIVEMIEIILDTVVIFVEKVKTIINDALEILPKELQDIASLIFRFIALNDDATGDMLEIIENFLNSDEKDSLLTADYFLQTVELFQNAIILVFKSITDSSNQINPDSSQELNHYYMITDIVYLVVKDLLKNVFENDVIKAKLRENYKTNIENPTDVGDENVSKILLFFNDLINTVGIFVPPLKVVYQFVYDYFAINDPINKFFTEFEKPEDSILMLYDSLFFIELLDDIFSLGFVNKFGFDGAFNEILPYFNPFLFIKVILHELVDLKITDINAFLSDRSDLKKYFDGNREALLSALYLISIEGNKNVSDIFDRLLADDNREMIETIDSFIETLYELVSESLLPIIKNLEQGEMDSYPEMFDFMLSQGKLSRVTFDRLADMMATLFGTVENSLLKNLYHTVIFGLKQLSNDDYGEYVIEYFIKPSVAIVFSYAFIWLENFDISQVLDGEEPQEESSSNILIDIIMGRINANNIDLYIDNTINLFLTTDLYYNISEMFYLFNDVAIEFIEYINMRDLSGDYFYSGYEKDLHTLGKYPLTFGDFVESYGDYILYIIDNISKDLIMNHYDSTIMIKLEEFKAILKTSLEDLVKKAPKLPLLIPAFKNIIKTYMFQN